MKKRGFEVKIYYFLYLAVKNALQMFSTTGMQIPPMFQFIESFTKMYQQYTKMSICLRDIIVKASFTFHFVDLIYIRDGGHSKVIAMN